jgi:hypothetical protein
MIREMGIMAIQKIASHPLTFRMKIGSPCTDAQSDFIVPISPPRVHYEYRLGVSLAAAVV